MLIRRVTILFYVRRQADITVTRYNNNFHGCSRYLDNRDARWKKPAIYACENLLLVHRVMRMLRIRARIADYVEFVRLSGVSWLARGKSIIYPKMRKNFLPRRSFALYRTMRHAAILCETFSWNVRITILSAHVRRDKDVKIRQFRRKSVYLLHRFFHSRIEYRLLACKANDLSKDRHTSL